jgi:hypothetical protein
MTRRTFMSTRTARLIAASAIASLALAGSAQARQGADDPAGHIRHGRSADDAQPHAKKHHHKRHHKHHGRHHGRHGADDPAGHR